MGPQYHGEAHLAVMLLDFTRDVVSDIVCTQTHTHTHTDTDTERKASPSVRLSRGATNGTALAESVSGERTGGTLLLVAEHLVRCGHRLKRLGGATCAVRVRERERDRERQRDRDREPPARSGCAASEAFL